MLSLFEAVFIHRLQALILTHSSLVLGAIFLARWLILALFAGAIIAFFLPSTTKWQKHWLKEVGWSVMLAFLCTLVLSELIQRIRPFHAFPSLVTELIPDPASIYSWPSGHSASAVAFAFSIQRIWPKYGLLFWFAAISVLLGRVLVGVHYPTDVASGAVVGCAAAAFVQYLHRHRKPSPV